MQQIRLVVRPFKQYCPDIDSYISDYTVFSEAVMIATFELFTFYHLFEVVKQLAASFNR